MSRRYVRRSKPRRVVVDRVCPQVVVSEPGTDVSVPGRLGSSQTHGDAAQESAGAAQERQRQRAVAAAFL